jgi:methylglutaconyl-CoA hydratase
MNTYLALDHPFAHVTRVTLQRAAVRNAFNPALISELTLAFEAIAADTQVRAVILAAEGPAFCAGADLQWMQSMASFIWEENHADAQALTRMARCMRRHQRTTPVA